MSKYFCTACEQVYSKDEVPCVEDPNDQLELVCEDCDFDLQYATQLEDQEVIDNGYGL